VSARCGEDEVDGWPEVEAALLEMWTDKESCPKELAADVLLCRISGEVQDPKFRTAPRLAVGRWKARHEYLQRNGFCAAEESCKRCGRLFDRIKRTRTLCDRCRAGKKPVPIWGTAMAPAGREKGRRTAATRPLRSPTTRPVEARTDTGALFELLADVGCRMPKGGEQ
jgi:hypothetical protein